jgi:predicted dehydrogenase
LEFDEENELTMAEKRIGIIMHGVTGRMGMNQHLLRSIVAIRAQGGVQLSERETILPEPVLVGRSEAKLRQLAEQAQVERWTTDVESVLTDPDISIYFDAQTTDRRHDAVARAIEAGKYIYCEKPTALDTAAALDLYHRAEARGVRHGVVQDKLWLPGLQKLKTLRTAVSSARSSPCAESSATGSSRAICYRRNGLRGTIARRPAGG